MESTANDVSFSGENSKLCCNLRKLSLKASCLRYQSRSPRSGLVRLKAAVATDVRRHVDGRRRLSQRSGVEITDDDDVFARLSVEITHGNLAA